MHGVGAAGDERDDVYLARQDGRVLDEVLLPPAHRGAERLYVVLMDGMHQTELEHRLATDPDALPNLRRLHERAAVLGPGKHGTTFGGGPLVCRAGLEFFDILDELLPHISEVGSYFRMRLTELQRPGGKRLACADFLRGHPVQSGAVFQAHPS